MLTQAIPPMFYRDVDTVLSELLSGVQTILGPHLIGMYLDGSLTSGDFDRDSDIDFVVVTDTEISAELFLALQEMHQRIAALDSWCAIELEGSYLSQAAIRRYDRDHARHPRLQRGKEERLEMVQHKEDWLIHRHVLRERGLTLVGPAPQTLIDPVSPNALRRAMLPVLQGWAVYILNHPAEITKRGYQSYTVLSLCRILYTLQTGGVASKPVAARWAQETLDPRWKPLIERTWASRHNPELEASAEDVNGTQEFIRYALERSSQFELPLAEA